MDRPEDRIIVALDVDSESAALELVDRLAPYAGMFKVGKQLFTRFGPSIVRAVRDRGADIFLDLKFHDIPNTVMQASREAARMGARLFNVHVSGGSAMMRAAASAVQNAGREFGSPRPRVLGVTLLTSITGTLLRRELLGSRPLRDTVVHYAGLARKAGLDGVVASAREIKIIRAACPAPFIIVTPGIRPAWASSNDQKRIMTPERALRAGADYLVIGRPITAANNPEDAAGRILDEIAGVRLS